MTRISAKMALKLMQESKGKFFTATFTKKDGTERMLNCQYLPEQSEIMMGYVKVKDSSLVRMKEKNCIRSINLQTLKVLKINGNVYNIR